MLSRQIPIRNIIVNLGASDRGRERAQRLPIGDDDRSGARARFQFAQSVTRPEKKYLKSVERTDGAERKPAEREEARDGGEMLMVR